MGGQLYIQTVAVLIVVAWGAVASWVIYKVVDLLVGLRVSEDSEREGLDLSEHGERAYAL